MPFTQDELDGAIEKIIRTSVRFEYDNLGVRKVGTSFNDIQDAAAGVFVSFPNAPFYVARLGADRLLVAVQDEATFISDFISTVRAVGRNVSPVRKLSFLANARTALDALATATGQRAGAFLDIEDVPAFKRFDLNTQKFLDVEGKNIRQAGDIVPTPQEARAAMMGLAGQLRDLHEELLRRVTVLRDSISDFSTLNLPERLSRDIMANARSVLADRLEELEALSPEDRLEQIRAATLDVLATRAAVRGFGSLSPQGLFLRLSGSGAPFTDTTHPALSAVLQSDLVGPYAIFTGQDKLTLLLEATDLVELQLPGSFVPFLQVITRGPVEVLAGANEFSINLTGFAPVNVTVTPLSPTLAEPWDIVDSINAAVGAQPIVANLDFIPIKTTQDVDIDITGSPNDADFILPVAVGTWASLGVVIGDRILVKDPTSTMDDDLFDVVSFPTAQTASTTIVRAGALVDEVNKVVQVGTDAAIIWTVRVADASSQASLDNQWVMRLDDIEDGTLANLGVFPGSQVRARKTSTQTIEQFINVSASTFLVGTTRLTAISTFVESQNLLGRTEPNAGNILVLYAFRGRGDITVGGTTATFVLPTLAGELSIGDLLVIRETDITADVGLVGTIATVGGTTVTATFSSSVSTDTDVLVEGVPDPAGLVDSTLRIAEGGFQDGDYTVESVLGIDLTIGQVITNTADVGGQPFFFQSVSVGGFRLDLQTTNTTLSSELEVQAGSDDASGEFFTTVPKAATGTTAFFQLPEQPKNLEAGDQLELHNTAVASPDIVRVVKEVFGDGLIELEVPLPVTQAALTFTQGSPVPFGRIRKRVKQNFEEFSAAAAIWLNKSANDLLSYFRELDAVLNALIVSGNPTPVQINDAVFHLQDLLGILTIAGATSAGKNPLDTIESAINGYTAAVVPQVDNLITTYEQKGADRAKALLLEGQFSKFFGLDRDEISYSGHVQKIIKDVARLDLPVRKDGRQTLEAVVADMELASWEDTDFEFSSEDIDPADLIDIPGEGDISPNIPIP